MDVLIDLTDPAATEARHVGRKAAGLAMLGAAGFPSVPGAVLPVDASDADAAAFVADVHARWPGPVAVRSSTTWEDHATRAHAGQTLTRLHVSGADAVADAVAACRAAPLPDGRAPGDGLAVLVQPMLAPRVAGVAFTADPVTGERDVVRIAATAGVADALLAGEAVGSDVVVRAGRVEGDLGALLEADALAVAALAMRVAAELGGPQDVEWAMVDGEVQLLQARPITVLPVAPTLPSGNGWEKDVAHYSEPLTPFGWWALHASMDVAGAVFAEAGVLIDGLEEVFAGGEVYGRAKPAVGPADPGRLPPPPAAVLGLLARLAPPLRARTAAARRVLETDLVDQWVADWEDHERAGFLGIAEQLRGVALADLDDATLVAHLRTILAHARAGVRSHFRVFVPYVLSAHALHVLLEDLDDWTPAATSQLLAGASPATRAADDDLRALRRGIDAVTGLADALRATPADPLGVLRASTPELADELARWLDRHGSRALNYDAGVPLLRERPQLVTRLLLVAPTDRADDAHVAAATAARARLPAGRRDAFDAALALARDRHPLREDTVIIGGDALLGLARGWMLEVGRRLEVRGVLGGRADAAYLTGDDLTAALLGRAPAATTQQLVVRRRSEEAWTRATPGPATIGHAPPPPDVSRLPTPLRRVNEAVLWMVGLEYPGADAGGKGPDPADGDALTRGVAASAGVATGTVRIVRDHRDLDRLREGDVLVCRVASPAWTPALGLVVAVVADGGGALSHAGIAAREQGIPAVLGTVDATTVLREGQRVHVDGRRGVVLAADDRRDGGDGPR